MLERVSSSVRTSADGITTSVAASSSASTEATKSVPAKPAVSSSEGSTECDTDPISMSKDTALVSTSSDSLTNSKSSELLSSSETSETARTSSGSSLTSRSSGSTFSSMSRKSSSESSLLESVKTESRRPGSKMSMLSYTKIKQTPPDAEEVLINDSQEDEHQRKYKRLLDNIERCANTSAESSTSSSVTNRKLLDKSAGSSSSNVVTTVPRTDTAVAVSSGSTDGESAGCLKNTLSVEQCRGDESVPDNQTNGTTHYFSDSSSIMWEESFLFPSQASVADGLGHVAAASPNILEEIIGVERPSNSAESLKRPQLSPDLTYTRLRKTKRIRTSTLASPKSNSQSQSSQTNSLPAVTSDTHTPVRTSHRDVVHTPANTCQITPTVETGPSASAWSLNDSEMFPAESSAKKSGDGCNDTVESNDLFSSKFVLPVTIFLQ